MNTATYLLNNLPVRSPASSTPFSPSIISGLVGISDALCIFGSGFAVYLIYVGSVEQTIQLYLTALTIATFVTIAAFYAAGLYKFELICRLTKQLRDVLGICAIVFLVLLSLAFALKISAQFSRVWVFSSVLSATFLVCVGRACCYAILRNRAESGRLTRNFVVVGAGEQAKRLLAHLDRTSEPWNLVVGIFDDRVERIGPELAGYPVLGTVSDLLEYARKHRVDDVIITIPWSAEQRIREIVSRVEELPAHVHLGSDLVGYKYPHGNYSTLGGVPMFNIADKPLAGWKIVVKYLEDKILAALLLILFAPLMCLIAVAIKLDSKGPVLFRQPRYGFNNGPFSMFKFRTMYDEQRTDGGVPQATMGDPRVTRVGRFLRRTSLDELPQLFNVLQGTMSLVGPRPHAVPHNEEYAVLIRGYFARHRVKPGITGWAQVSGLRGETDVPEKMKARVKHDIHYIENWSLLFDLLILARTARVVWIQESAY